MEIEFQLNRNYLVIAYNYQHFYRWCYENDIDHEQLRVRYISFTSQMLGYRPEDSTLILLGPWFTNVSHGYYERISQEIKRFETLGAEVVEIST